MPNPFSACEPLQEYVTSLTLIPQKVQWYQVHQNTVIIVNPASSLVLDAKEPEVKLAEYTGSPLQQWQFECTSDGNFSLKNLGTGRYLHVRGPPEMNGFLVTEAKSNKWNQLWRYNPQDQTIGNPASNKVLNIREEYFIPGGQIQIHHKDGGNNQKFTFQLNQ